MPVYSLGGTVSGLGAGTSLVLQDNLSDSTTISANGSFSFPGRLANGASYSVTVLTQPSGQLCTITGAAGSMGAANLSTLAVNCVATNVWTWKTGSSAAASYGVYGTQGTPAAANTPGARAGSVAWTDAVGKLWLFGGSGYDGTGSSPNAQLNDLWTFDVGSGQWTWVAGSSASLGPGSYGSQGVPAASNAPSARTNAMGWKDANGDLWLFGGYGLQSSGSTFGSFNDLWRFRPSTGQWTWIGGQTSLNVAGQYGTLGVAAGANLPGARQSAASWTDASGNLWLFGGMGYDSSGAVGALNDLWEYSVGTGQWTWMAGPKLLSNVASYGARGVPAASNIPGARSAALSWFDKSGNLWLFGGLGIDSTGTSGQLNDLWKYTVGSGQWTWMNGATTISATAVYGTLGMAAASNVPGARDSAFGWVDGAGDLWLLGGRGYDATSAGFLSDLWRFSVASGQWTWVGGASAANAPASFGTQGIAAISNTPGGRVAAGWSTPRGTIWLFGGIRNGATGNGMTQTDFLNDLWEITPN